MSDWKKIGKSSYNLSVGKFAEWAPSYPFTIPYQGPKVRYSEGDEITDVTDPGFDIDFTGRPLSAQHFPCGYWHKNYIPPQQIIYTSLCYPIEVVESIISNVIVVEGNFKSIILFYDNGIESLSISNISLIEGIFRSSLLTYSYTENISSTSITLQVGVFKNAILDYSIGIESINSSSITLSSAVFKDAIIEYLNAEVDSITSNISLISGYYGS